MVSNLMTDEFDHVMIELDFGTRGEHRMRRGNGIESMEALMLARSKLAFGELHFISHYDQLRLYFVTEWVGKFGMGSIMTEFKQFAFEHYFQHQLQRLVQGIIRITPAYEGPITIPCYLGTAIVSALTSETHGFAQHIHGDAEDV
jgi:hypothetical protein